MKKTIIIKPSLSCNLRCGYCYEFSRPNRSVFEKGGLTWELCIQIAERFARIFPNSEIFWIFHGGEPLLMGSKNFEKILNAFNSLNEKGIVKFEASIQTNGTLLNDEWINLISKNKNIFSSQSIGVSLDGPAIYNDKARFFVNSKKSVAKTVEINIKKCLDSGLRIVIETVVGRHNINQSREIYDFISEINPTVSKYTPCYDMDMDGRLIGYGISPMEFADFLINIFSYWRKDLATGRKFIIDPICSIISTFLNKHGTYCEYSDEKCDNFISIFPNGDFGTCEVYTGDFFKKHAYLGNLFKISDNELVEKVLNSNCFNDYLEFRENMFQKCKLCEVQQFCKGGCFAHREKFLLANKSSINMYCEAKKKIVRYIRDYFNQIIFK